MVWATGALNFLLSMVGLVFAPVSTDDIELDSCTEYGNETYGNVTRTTANGKLSTPPSDARGTCQAQCNGTPTDVFLSKSLTSIT